MSYYDLILFEKRINKFFPSANALEWDNVGLQIAGDNVKIKRALITLDVNTQVLEYAVMHKINLIISHHPLFLKSLNNIISFKDYKSSLIRDFLLNNIALFVIHTNLDRYYYNLLSERLKLKKIQKLSDDGLGSYGYLSKPVSLLKLLDIIKKELKLKHIRYIGDKERLIKTVACVGGSGAGYIDNDLKMKNIDLLLTADIKYHNAQLADELNIAVVDAGHYYTENIMMLELKKKLNKIFKNKIKFILNNINTDPVKFY